MSKSKKKLEIIDHDQLFKQLLTTFFLEFLELFTPEFFASIDPNSLEILPLEYFTDIDAGERKAMDVIVRINLLGRPNAPASSRVSVVVNCEHQSTSRANFHRRMFFTLPNCIANTSNPSTQLLYSPSTSHIDPNEILTKFEFLASR